LAFLGGSARAVEPATGLSEAESRATSATAEIAAAQGELDAARAEHSAAASRARPLARAVRASRAAARDLRADLLDRQRQARTRIAALEESHEEEEEEHDQEVANGIGISLAALLGVAIALAWRRFRTWAPVDALTGVSLAQALGICLGGGFLLLIVGAALGGGEGILAAVGALLFGLGLVLPAAFLLARHSLEVERGNAKPLLKRDRFPDWVARVAAALLLLLALGGLGSALFAEDPSEPDISAQLRAESDALERGRGAAQLKEARAKAEAARRRAVRPLARERVARAAVRKANGALASAKNRLVDAQADAQRFERRLAAQVAREEEEAAREAIRLERVAREEAEEAEEFEEESPSGCDPNYSGCVPPYPPDVDCAEVGETVSVYGADPHGLDADGDGSGCE